MNRQDFFAVPGRTLPFRMESKPVIVLGDIALHLAPYLSVPPDNGHELPMLAGLGGSGGLVAAGLSRLGVSVSILANRADDPVGATLEEMCQSLGVDTRYLFADCDDVQSTSHIFGPAGMRGADVSYVVNSANLNLKADDLRWVDWGQFGTVIVCCNMLASDPAKSAVVAAINAMREVGGTVAFLVDVPGPYWKSANEGSSHFRHFANQSDILIGDAAALDFVSEAISGGKRWAADQMADYRTTQQGVGLICTLHKEGKATAHLPDGVCVNSDEVLDPVDKSTMLEAFAAGMIASLTTGHAPDLALRRACAAAALSAKKMGAASTMPTAEQVDTYLDQLGAPILTE